MDLIHVNRQVFNKLKDDEELCKIHYLYDIICSVDKEHILIEEYEELTEGLYTIIFKNESLIEKVGMKRYFHSDYKAEDHVEGTWYRTGKYGLIAFDWSMDNETDENWSYSFSIFQIL